MLNVGSTNRPHALAAREYLEQIVAGMWGRREGEDLVVKTASDWGALLLCISSGAITNSGCAVPQELVSKYVRICKSWFDKPVTVRYSKLAYDPRPSWDVHLYVHASCFRETPGKKAVEKLKSRFTTGT